MCLENPAGTCATRSQRHGMCIRQPFQAPNHNAMASEESKDKQIPKNNSNAKEKKQLKQSSDINKIPLCFHSSRPANIPSD